ncbi:uncharacterized protein LOC132391955 [Hypanus sabinus]|uniref:uncharacterized protein LOC132391955 n=1 Tax=Hypanus sabinus TaxID=79690 RepID=UPI0028C46CB7|nr:uncharacterized protein LOC132391955 [Hypanus sabinus]
MLEIQSNKLKVLEELSSRNNLELNTLKTKEMIVDFRRHPPVMSPLTVLGSPVSTVENFRFLGTTISQDLKWEQNISFILKKAQQRMYFLRLLSKYGLLQELLLQFYTAVTESVLCTSITVWFGAATKQDRTRLQRTVRTAERIIGASLPSIVDLYSSRLKKRAGNIIKVSFHPAHRLFELLPSGRRFRSLQTKTNRHWRSFFPTVVTLLNS